jgi:hypothetical protein
MILGGANVWRCARKKEKCAKSYFIERVSAFPRIADKILSWAMQAILRLPHAWQCHGCAAPPLQSSSLRLSLLNA